MHQCVCCLTMLLNPYMVNDKVSNVFIDILLEMFLMIIALNIIIIITF